jgi:hypothetical protein
MGIIVGQDAKLEIGIGDTWGQTADPTCALEFTGEDLKYVPVYKAEDALVGGKTSGRMDIIGKKVEGGISFLAKPVSVGFFLGAALGTEAAVAAHAGGDTTTGDTAFDHVFTPVAGGSSADLPWFIAVVDRKVNTFGYKGLKIDTLDIDASPQDYVRCKVACVGYDEDAADTISGDTLSSLKAFQFSQGTVQVGTDGAESTYADVVKFNLSYRNNLEKDLFTMSTGLYMAEPQPQAREITATLDVLYSAATDTTRTTYFKGGITVSMVVTFTSSELVDAANYYSLEFDMPRCYITDASPVVGGPERIRQTLVVRATEQDSLEAVTATLVNARSTKYIT